MVIGVHRLSHSGRVGLGPHGSGFGYLGIGITLIGALLGTGVEAQSLVDLARQAEKRGMRTGIVVRDLRTGADLFRHRSRESFIPASNQKLFTVAAALWGLSASHRFRTVFRLRGGVLEVLAAGDPNWARGGAHDPAVVFRRVAAALRKAGITRIRDVRLLRGAFTGPTRPPGWPKDQFDRPYCAPTGGLVLEAGCFVARISAGSGRARVDLLAPPTDASFGGRIKMSSRKKKRFAYWLSHHGKKFTAHGEFSTRARPVEVRGVCQDPEWLFDSTLRSVLRREGVTLDADAKARDLPVLTWESGLTEAFTPMLSKSSNFHAEQVLRRIGAEKKGAGTFVGGYQAVREIVGAKIELPTAFRVVDGSGLSRENRVTPRLMVTLLRRLFRGEHAKLLAVSLPCAGEGTLERRFRRSGQKIVGRATRAKTGTINGVKCISGIVQTLDDGVRVFTILMNVTKGGSTSGAAALQDKMIEAIYHGRYPAR